MASLPFASLLSLSIGIIILLYCCCVSCYGKEISRYYVTPDPETSCGEDHESCCLTLDQFASEDINKSVTLILIPGQHNLTESFEVVGVDQFSILADTSVNIQCTSPASFLFEGISNLEITNTAIVSCGGGDSSGAVQVRSVQQFNFNNVTLQESAGVSVNVQDSNGLVTGARFIGNAGAGMNITSSTVAFEGTNTFSDNLGGGIASYDSTLQFIGVNQFTNNTATTKGGGISAISSTINCSGNMTFEYNSAEQYGGGVYASSGTRMTSKGHNRFVGNTLTAKQKSDGGAGLFAEDKSTLDFRGTISFIHNVSPKYGRGGAIYVTTGSTFYSSGNSSFTNNSALFGGGVCAWSHAKVGISGTSKFIGNSAHIKGGGVCARRNATVGISGTSNFINNSAQEDGGGVYARNDATVDISGTSKFIGNSANVSGGGVFSTRHTKVSLQGIIKFINNSAQEDGGGVYAEYGATVDISGTSNFIGNSAQVDGGGVYARNDATVDIRGTSNFIGNSAKKDGGGVCARNGATVDISGTTSFTDNFARQQGGGLYAVAHATVNLSGINSFIGNSVWFGGGGLSADYIATVYISGSSRFVNNSARGYGAGVNARNPGAAVYINGSSKFISNSVLKYGGGIASTLEARVYVSGTSHFIENMSALYGGGVSLTNRGAVHISGTCNFVTNAAQYGGGISSLRGEMQIRDGNCSLTKNSAQDRGGGIYLEDTSTLTTKYGNITLWDNWSQYGGGISIQQQSEVVLEGNAVFSNNSASYGGAIQAFEGGKITIRGSGSFNSNLATISGGALALAGGSVLHVFEKSFLSFAENGAGSFGGAIYVEDNSVYCSYDWNINGFLGINDTSINLCNPSRHDLPSCLNELANSTGKFNVSFSGNSALAGSAIFGGEIDKTLSNIIFRSYFSVLKYPTTVADLLFYFVILDIDDTNERPMISSNPNRICRCVNGQPDFSDPPSPHEVTVYPGQTVGVSLVAVGQRNGTVPSTTTAQYDPDSGATFRDLQSTQRIDHTTCMKLHYTIFSRKQTETFKIYVDELCGLEGIPLTVSVKLLKCPIGFTLSNSSNQCVCEERLQKYTSKCNISNQEITRTASEDFWVGVDNTNGTEGLILHPHCPFDYCTTDTVNFTLVEFTDAHKISLIHTTNDSNTNNSTVNDTDATDYAVGNSIDAQCNFNRSGLLCGKCQKGFSLVFGSSKCLKCSNSYLSLLIAFALAGIVLVVFLLVLKLTVAVGTINGLIFYANIVSVNREKLFPSGETNILTVFIAWVNLDLGIETCFFDGMDAYSKAWLQYAFPVYVWALVGAIILVSRHSTRIVRSLGNNPVAVLATLFLLSYAKLLRSIINPLFVTFLEYPTDSKAVWLVDGNIPYLNDKHIPLFLTSLLALFLLFIPFTLLLLLGQWIQAHSERKCFTWISDYRVSTFLDVYHGPFKSKHRYWCGLQLVTRFCLFLVFAFNVNGDPSVNVLAIVVSSYGVHLMFIWFKVYKTWYLNVLEASFICNLSMLAAGTYYVEISGGNQSALTYTSVSVAFATFCGIVVYHSCLQIKDTMLFKKLYKKLTHCLKSSADDTGAGDNEMKEIEEDPPRKYTKPPTTSVVEITH